MKETIIKPAFFKITEDKKSKIQSIALSKFAEHGFKKASFNEIIRLSGISKGGMYKYCTSKNELYHHIVEISLQDLMQHINQFDTHNDESLLQRIMRYTEHEFDFYSRNVNYYRLHQRIFIQSNEEIDLELRKQYQSESLDIFQTIMNSSKEKLEPDILKIYRWVITGMKNEYYYEMSEVDDIEKEKYKAELKKIFSILNQIS